MQVLRQNVQNTVESVLDQLHSNPFCTRVRILTKANTCSHPKANGIRGVATLSF